MSILLQASPVTADILDTLPDAVDPFALSLNENPFPPLPAVRSALIRSIDAANRYPEFLPERLRRLIAGSYRGLRRAGRAGSGCQRGGDAGPAGGDASR